MTIFNNYLLQKLLPTKFHMYSMPTNCEASSQKDDSGGFKAYRNGKSLENQLEKWLYSCGYKKVLPQDFISFCTQNPNQLVFARQFIIGKDLFERNKKCDFILQIPNQSKNSSQTLVIECRYQNVEGTTMEKLPFTLISTENLKYFHILVIEGKAFTEGILSYLTNYETNNYYFKGYYFLNEFKNKVQKGFPFI